MGDTWDTEAELRSFTLRNFIEDVILLARDFIQPILRSFTLRNFIEDRTRRNAPANSVRLRSFTLRNFIEDLRSVMARRTSANCEALRFATSLRKRAGDAAMVVNLIAKLYASQLH